MPSSGISESNQLIVFTIIASGQAYSNNMKYRYLDNYEIVCALTCLQKHASECQYKPIECERCTEKITSLTKQVSFMCA
jgi:hypothetical protein